MKAWVLHNIDDLKYEDVKDKIIYIENTTENINEEKNFDISVISINYIFISRFFFCHG